VTLCHLQLPALPRTAISLDHMWRATAGMKTAFGVSFAHIFLARYRCLPRTATLTHLSRHLGLLRAGRTAAHLRRRSAAFCRAPYAPFSGIGSSVTAWCAHLGGAA